MNCNIQFLIWGAVLWQLFVWFVKAVIAQHRAQNQSQQEIVKVEVVDEREVFFERISYENEILKKTLQAKETAFRQVSEEWVGKVASTDACPECSNFFRSFEGREYRNPFRYIVAMDKYRDDLISDYNALVKYVEKLEEGFLNAVGNLPDLEED